MDGNARGLQKRLRDSRRTGNLSLAGASLGALPPAVCNARDFLEPDERLYECVDLVKMDLNYNNIPQLPEEVGILGESLVVLQAAHNPLRSLPTALSHFRALKLLNLSNCQFSQFPAVICTLFSLVELRLDNNGIEALPANDFGNLTELQVLQLEHNRLRSVPHSIGRLQKMVRLHLSQNQLTELPESLGALSKLETLEIRENQLQNLSARVTTGLSRLKVLDARRNRLTELPMLPQSTSLKDVLLSFNQVATLDVARLAGAVNLATLDLADNKVAAIDSMIADLPELAFLNVSNNELRGLPHALGYMPKLKRLIVEQNPIRTINRSILTGSTENLKKYLRSRGPAPSGLADTATGSATHSAWSVVEDQQLNLDKIPADTAESILGKMLQQNQPYNTCQTINAGGTGAGTLRCLPLVLRLLQNRQFEKVTVIKFERLGLDQVPVELTQLPLLQSLSLAMNNLKAPSFADLIDLRNRGSLATYFPSLQRLNLSGNKLRYISAALINGKADCH